MLVTNDVALLTFVPFAILILNMADASAYAPYIIVLADRRGQSRQHGHACWQSAESFLYNRFALSPADFFSAPSAPCGGQPAAVHGRAVRAAPGRHRRHGRCARIQPRRLPALSVLFVLCLLCVFRVAPYQLLTAVVLTMLTLFMRGPFSGSGLQPAAHICIFSLFFAGNMGKDPAGVKRA